jgi:hypothetical protein
MNLYSTSSGYGPIAIRNPNVTTTITGPISSNTITISGSNVTGIFLISSPTVIQNLTLANGIGACLSDARTAQAAFYGGAIYTTANLTIAAEQSTDARATKRLNDLQHMRRRTIAHSTNSDKVLRLNKHQFTTESVVSSDR